MLNQYTNKNTAQLSEPIKHTAIIQKAETKEGRRIIKTKPISRGDLRTMIIDLHLLADVEMPRVSQIINHNRTECRPATTIDAQELLDLTSALRLRLYHQTTFGDPDSFSTDNKLAHLCNAALETRVITDKLATSVSHKTSLHVLLATLYLEVENVTKKAARKIEKGQIKTEQLDYQSYYELQHHLYMINESINRHKENTEMRILLTTMQLCLAAIIPPEKTLDGSGLNPIANVIYEAHQNGIPDSRIANAIRLLPDPLQIVIGQYLQRVNGDDYLTQYLQQETCIIPGSTIAIARKACITAHLDVFHNFLRVLNAY